MIVCDDGSTDDLDGALTPYLDQIVLLRKPNGGEASAKNRGIAAATGERLYSSTRMTCSHQTGWPLEVSPPTGRTSTF